VKSIAKAKVSVCMFVTNMSCARYLTATKSKLISSKGSSIYDVHTRGGGGLGQCGRMWTGGGGVKTANDVHTRVAKACKAFGK
jgi:hypothetical protein